MPAGRHPYFDDKNTIPWHTTLAPALAEARVEDKRVLVSWGLRTCPGTRTMIEKTIWKEEIAEYLLEHFIAVAASADAADPDIAALLPLLPKSAPTPLTIYLSADGHVIHSTAGARPASVLLQDMTEASGRK